MEDQNESTEGVTPVASDDLLDALKLAASHLEKSTDTRVQNALYLSPGDQMRRAADAMDQRDMDIERIRQVIARAEASNSVDTWKGKI